MSLRKSDKPEIIRSLSVRDLECSVSLFSEVVRELADSEIDQWDEKYPTSCDVNADIHDGNAYGFFVGDMLASYMTLNRFNDKEYLDVEFSGDTETALTIHRLAVTPSFQSRGLAGKMIDFAEEYALCRGYASLRLDVFSLNPAAIHLYEKKGYLRRGTVNFRKGAFHLYEKPLSGNRSELFEAVLPYESSVEIPVTLKAGELIECLKESDPDGDWPGWILCSNGITEAWTPHQIIEQHENGCTVSDNYCNAEFDLTPGELLSSVKELNGWIWGCKTGFSEKHAWAPLNCLKKITHF